MPLTAHHATAGVLDLTADTLGSITWQEVHRAKPRAPLSCRECGHGLHAKASHRGMRFFAHDAGAPECALTGETIAHRLLKMELATAIRAAGWHAELEVPGTGWRADVLATSPDGQTRMAWEAQLAATTADELKQRTATMAAEGVSVCWVTDKDRPWVGHVPTVRIRGVDQGGDLPEPPTGPLVVDGLGVFTPRWCRSRRRCEYGDTPRGLHPGPCAGHGAWRPTAELALGAFVQHVLQGVVKAHVATARRPFALDRHDPGPHVWTTRPHFLAERAEVDARAARERWLAERQGERDAAAKAENDHLTAIADLLARQKALTGPATELVARETGGYVGVRDPDVSWAMGVPLFVEDRPRAVISPVAGRVKGAVRDRLVGLTIVVATRKEQERLAKVCAPRQRFEVFDVDVPAQPTATPAGLTIRQATRLMLGPRSY